MKKKLAIIHTTPVTIEPLKELALNLIDDCEIMNFMDDTILPQLMNNGGDIEEVAHRWANYARTAEQLGADCILSGCSSVGGLVPMVQPQVNIPIIRIDEAMAEYAVHSAERIGVAATMETTLKPTIDLLKQKAAENRRTVQIESILVASAYEKLMANDKQGHDHDLSAALRNLVKKTDLVVLAQASMARVIATFSPEEQRPFVTSPQLGMECVKKTFQTTTR
ncbi:aspartate/glutamate racemase family protein [Fictibacillus terranigra]|uniref:Aspartate/glutamate racemase family protein n=1 Tax=Fictibacillus terranigra TaxID=3058424 RepID=A0ABT8E508_9BACL|nr:aspartate/glutamate racemase family protein [Fictibacillus sp. CENA-BCM004]MDN4072993.1 aspartate/glutamate racemase family protein [Fictibacillus sp. CENA-BCM004]